MIPAVRQPQVRRIVRAVYYPLLVVAVMGAFMALKSFFPGDKLAVLTTVLGVTAVIVVHVSERLFPYREEWNVSRGEVLSDFVFTNLVLPSLSKATEIFLAWFFVSSVGSLLREPFEAWWPHEWPVLGQLALILLIGEFFFYWTHRWGHRFEALWHFHSIHHVVERVYWNNAGRFHPLDLSLNWLFYFAPIFLFGVSGEVLAAFLTLNAVTGLLEHANVDFEAGPLNRIFNTAQLHRWHHSVVVRESSTNFGKVLSVWDQVFGTYYLPHGREVGEVGVTGEAIPKEVSGQMRYPFRRLWLKAGLRLRRPSSPRTRLAK